MDLLVSHMTVFFLHRPYCSPNGNRVYLAEAGEPLNGILIVSNKKDLKSDCLSQRVEALLNMLSPEGRLICFEKTWNLGRRLFFQRAMKNRKLVPICDPVPCSYRELGDVKVDGPLYEVSRISVSKSFQWKEAPFYQEGETLYRCCG